MSGLQRQTTVSSEAETRKLAQCLADVVDGPITICLVGDLGTGKTSFVRAFAERRGVAPSSVVSPTFTLCQTYSGDIVIHHLDAYRLNSIAEFVDLGVDEMFGDQAVTFVEWGDRVAAALPADRLTISFSTESELGRHIEAQAEGAISQNLLAEWSAHWDAHA